MLARPPVFHKLGHRRRSESACEGGKSDHKQARKPDRMLARPPVFHKPVHTRCIPLRHKRDKPTHREHHGARLEPVEAGRDCSMLARKPAQEQHTWQGRTQLRMPGRNDGKQTGPSALQTGHTVALGRTVHRPAGHKPHSPRRD
jgi:hypothetical protein